jgi:hypothetical protein
MTDYPTQELNTDNTSAGVVPPTRWYRRWQVVGIVSLISAVVVAGVTITVLEAIRGQHAQTVAADTSHRAAIQHWWAGARNDFTALQNAVDDTRTAASRLDEAGVYSACQQMHDTAEVALQSKMPTPDAMLTAEVHSMIEDFHRASHLCMSEMRGSSNDWAGEYKSYVEQALRQMHAAQDFVNKSPTQT